MRRYFDMLVHRQIASMVSSKTSFYDRDTLEREAFLAEKNLRAIHRVQVARERYWLTCLIQEKPGDSFKAVAYERKGDRVLLCLTDYMLDVELYNLSPAVQPGCELYLKLLKADPKKNILIFVPE
jgi:exoribonuclease R